MESFYNTLYKCRRLVVSCAMLCVVCVAGAQSLVSLHKYDLDWNVGAGASGWLVPGTCAYLRGDNPLGKEVNQAFSAGLRAGFCFADGSVVARNYPGLYQGLGLEVNSFFARQLLGTPVSAYVYQGAPFARLSQTLWLGYEWQFGAACGWKEVRYDDDLAPGVVSTKVTAHMGVAMKLHYEVSDRVELAFGIEVRHFSNGNTSWPNSGVNAFGISAGVSYKLGGARELLSAIESTADGAERRWFYDITVYGGKRKRAVEVGEPAEIEICPGKFAVAGVQFAPMYRFGRWFAAGAALDLQWDESAGLAPYWVDGSSDESLKFYRPPFGKQVSAGISAHAELTAPIFSVNAGLGLDFVNPKGNKRFYQSLTLKAFITDRLYLNIGYRLGEFKDPQNLMIGLGVRL